VRRRSLVIALVLAVAAAGVVLAIVVGGGDDDEERAATTPPAPETAETATETDRETEPAPAPTDLEESRRIRAVEEAVTTLVEATEQGDGPRACGVIAGAEGEDLETCAAEAGIDLRTLPTSDEFSIEKVIVEGARARVRLSNGATVSLRRLEGRWKVSGVRTPAP
jgi:hypothetical protein